MDQELTDHSDIPLGNGASPRDMDGPEGGLVQYSASGLEMDSLDCGNSESFENFLMHLAIHFVNIPLEKVDQEINRALAMTGGFTLVDRAYVMSYDFERRVIDNTHEWCADGIQPMIENLQGVSMDGLEEWLAVHLKGGAIHVPDVKSLPVGSVLREILEPQDIITMVSVPLIYHGQCIGFVGFDAVRKKLDWSDRQVFLVKMLAELFTNAEMSRRRNIEILRGRTQQERMRRLLQKTVDAAGLAAWELDRESGMLHTVSGWHRMTGMDWDGRSIDMEEFMARVHPSDVQRVIEVIEHSALQSGEEHSLEFRMLGKHNEWCYLKAWWTEELENTGNRYRMYGGTKDISDSYYRSESNRCLHTISSRFVDHDSHGAALHAALDDIARLCGARAAELIPVGQDRESSALVMPDGPIVAAGDVSPGAPEFAWEPEMLEQLVRGVSMYSTTSREWMPLHSHLAKCDFLNPDLQICVPLLAGARLCGIIRILCPGFRGQVSPVYFDFLNSCAAILAGAIGRNHVEISLREQARMHRLILDSLNEIVFLTDPAGKITFINQAGCDFCGVDEEKLIGREIEEWTRPGEKSRVISHHTSNHRQADSGRSVIRIMNRHGETRWISLLLSPLHDDADILTGVLGTISDITDEKRWEETLLTEKIKAQSASDAKMLYISNFSHELRTPMHGVMGLLEMMMESGTLDPQNKSLVQDAYQSACSLMRLFDDVLDAAKLEQGTLRLETAVVDLHGCLQSIIRLFKRDMDKKNILLECDLSGAMPAHIEIDELRFRQIVSNLLSNAVKYTDTGKIRITVEPCEDEAMNGNAGTHAMRLLIEDTGIGIAEADMDSLFTPFVQIHADAHQGPIIGSGLGLPITKELVRLMKGDLSIHSEVGKGTQVEVRLPLVIADAESSLASGESAPDGMDGSLWFKGLSVLVAEDNEINRMVAGEHLRSFGCKVASVGNGLEAVQAYRQEAYDVVIMDCTMPVMDGFEACREILGAAGHGSPPRIIGCTASTSKMTLSKCMAAGMECVLVKPYSREQLHDILVRKSRDVERAVPEPAKPAVETNGSMPELARPILDLTLIQSMAEHLGGAGAGMAMLVDVFRDSSVGQLQDLIQALREKDRTQCARCAHRLRGGAASIGAARLSELCAWMEEYFNHPSEESPAELMKFEASLVREHSAALQALAAWLGSSEGANDAASDASP